MLRTHPRHAAPAQPTRGTGRHATFQLPAGAGRAAGKPGISRGRAPQAACRHVRAWV